MKKRLKFLGIIAIVAIIGFSVTACDTGSGSSGYIAGNTNGIWIADIQGVDVWITTFGPTWTLSSYAIDFFDTGTFTMQDNNVAILRVWEAGTNIVLGTAGLLSADTMRITLNEQSILPGTFIFTRISVHCGCADPICATWQDCCLFDCTNANDCFCY